ncbi:hypothetical protein ACFV2U_41415 [Streptomyces sp. NPDC059697]|uniref:hypothetical protein n=1 Tax=Streptomyces sp. NPDC059697 TaxID=3346912 RepID=UPI0036B78E45
MFQREHGVLVGLVPGIDQGRHAQDLAVRADQGDQPVLDRHDGDQLPLEGCPLLPQPVKLQRVLASAAVCEGD